MRVMTWNLWWQFGPWEERQPAIHAELRRLDPDVAMFQEVFVDDGRDQAEELAAAVGKQVARTHREDGAAHRFGNALLSRWPIVESHTLALPGGGGSPGHRSALAARIATPGGEQWFATTHLDWQYHASELRQVQLAETVRWVVELAGFPTADANPIVFGGDFNAVPDSDEVRRLTGLSSPYLEGVVFTDSWAAVGDGPGHTWTRENPHSADAQWPRRRIDYVFVSWPRPKPTGNPVGARLGGQDPHEGVVPSDHSAVIVELDDRSPDELLEQS